MKPILRSLIVLAVFGASGGSVFASSIVSAGYGGSDPVISEEVVNTGFGQVLSGTVVICEGGARCAYSLGNTSGWSDLLMFYDDAHGPFSNAVYDTADKAVLFSVDESGSFRSRTSWRTRRA